MSSTTPGSAPRFVRRRDVQMAAMTIPMRIMIAYVWMRQCNPKMSIGICCHSGPGLGMLAYQLLMVRVTRGLSFDQVGGCARRVARHISLGRRRRPEP